jgi:Zn-dependent protease with chaperone function
MLRQDRVAAKSAGREAILKLFEKIDQLGLPTVENAKRRHGWVARLWPVPNITERIQNLRDHTL